MNKKVAIGIALVAILLSTIFAVNKSKILEDEPKASHAQENSDGKYSSLDPDRQRDSIETYELPTQKFLNSGVKHGEYILNRVTSFNDSKDSEAYQALREQIFQYSRSANTPETRKSLKLALERGLLSPKEYYGELAHMLSAETNEGVSIFKEIIDSKDSYGAEVLFYALSSSPTWIAELSNEDKRLIASDLFKMRPGFSGDISMLGIADVSRYENWLKAQAQLYGQDEFLNQLSKNVVEPATDPREFHAIVSSGYYELLKQNGYTKATDFITQTMNSYRKSYPDTDASNIILKGFN